MKDVPLEPIPTPFARRLHHARLRLLPVLVLGCCVLAIAVLWNQNLAAPTMIGQAEAVRANVSSRESGVLTGMRLTRFQKVQAGEVLGQVLVSDPKFLEASLAVIRSELELLRANLAPIASQQRNAVDYAQLRLDWMRQRVELASARAGLQLATADLKRTEELFKEKIASQQLLDESRSNFDSTKARVEELEILVADGERSFKAMQPEEAENMLRISNEPLRAAIALQEARLRQTEAELSPITLLAPMDGIVTAIYHYSGEAVRAGDPIAMVASAGTSRIVGYLRAPVATEPKAGMSVKVRTRGLPRLEATTHIVEVGNQLEVLPPVMLGPLKLDTNQLGLPIEIAPPMELALRPGELVDITLISSAN